MKKSILLIISLFMLLSLAGCKEKPVEQKEDIYIIYTNDVHCAVQGDLDYASVVALKNELLEQHKYVTIVDAGDYIQGGSIGTLTKGSSIIEIMNKVGYDVAGIGNHEFDYSIDVLKNDIDMADFDVVSCNIEYFGKNENKLTNVKPYSIQDYDGFKVAFVGVSTPKSLTSSAPKNFMEDGEFAYGFYDGEDGKRLYNQVQKNIDEARKQGAQYVILLTHLGVGAADSPYCSYDLIQNTNGVDAVIDSHSHVTMSGDYYTNKDGKDITLTSTGTRFADIGLMVLKTDGTVETALFESYDKKDEETATFIADKVNEFEASLSKVVAKNESDLLISRDGFRTVRNRETNAANLVSDSIRFVCDTDIAFANGGGVRADIPAGDVTLNTVLTVLPFQNEIGIVKATGQMIADALEFGSRKVLEYQHGDEYAAGESGGFLHPSGLRYTIDTSIESTVTTDDSGLQLSLGENRRVCNIEVLEDGKYVPLDMNKTYTVAANSFLLFSNGDGNTSFNGAQTVTTSVDVDADILIEYLEDNLNGVIPASYNELEGRVTVK